MISSAVAKTIRSKVFHRATPALALTRGFASSSGGYNHQHSETSYGKFAAVGMAATAAMAIGVQSKNTSCDAKPAIHADKFANTAMFPPIQPYEKGTLKVSDVHTIAYSVYGNPQGKPVLVVHGGPGSGTTPSKCLLIPNQIVSI